MGSNGFSAELQYFECLPISAEKGRASCRFQLFSKIRAIASVDLAALFGKSKRLNISFPSVSRAGSMPLRGKWRIPLWLYRTHCP